MRLTAYFGLAVSGVRVRFCARVRAAGCAKRLRNSQRAEADTANYRSEIRGWRTIRFSKVTWMRTAMLIYYMTVGRGAPLVIVHGGPGASHDYFLPYLLPLARQNRLIFIDERGSGNSQKLDDPAGYTVENMVEDVEAVRQGLVLGKITLLGHSYGGVLAQAYALKYQNNLRHLILCSTFASTTEMNQVLARIKAAAPAEVREQIDREEKAGLYGHGKDYEKNRYTNDYMIAAWGGGYFPYLYQNHPDPNFDPTQSRDYLGICIARCGVRMANS